MGIGRIPISQKPLISPMGTENAVRVLDGAKILWRLLCALTDTAGARQRVTVNRVSKPHALDAACNLARLVDIGAGTGEAAQLNCAPEGFNAETHLSDRLYLAQQKQYHDYHDVGCRVQKINGETLWRLEKRASYGFGAVPDVQNLHVNSGAR